MSNNLCYVLAVEKLLGLEIPPKAQWLRVIAERVTRLTRIWYGWARTPWTSAALTVFLYCFRRARRSPENFEMVSGQRMMTSYFRVGGSRWNRRWDS